MLRKVPLKYTATAKNLSVVASDIKNLKKIKIILDKPPCLWYSKATKDKEVVSYG